MNTKHIIGFTVTVILSFSLGFLTAAFCQAAHDPYEN